jgi:hypothetical protein
MFWLAENKVEVLSKKKKTNNPITEKNGGMV